MNSGQDMRQLCAPMLVSIMHCFILFGNGDVSNEQKRIEIVIDKICVFIDDIVEAICISFESILTVKIVTNFCNSRLQSIVIVAMNKNKSLNQNNFVLKFMK